VSYRRPALPSIEKAVKAMEWPVEGWRGQCYAVAVKMVEAGLVEGRAVYGYYTGPISPRSNPFGNRAGLPFVHHGWIVTPEGWIVDPTRWVFEAVPPYIHAFEPDLCEDFDSTDGIVCRTCDLSGHDYDEGGNRWREDNERPRPTSTPEQRTIKLFLPPVSESSGEALHKVTHLLARPDLDAYEWPLAVSMDEVVWLANLSIHTLGQSAGVIYDCLTAAGHGAFIPIDNLTMVEAGAV
jgi:hypothetical protein